MRNYTSECAPAKRGEESCKSGSDRRSDSFPVRCGKKLIQFSHRKVYAGSDLRSDVVPDSLPVLCGDQLFDGVRHVFYGGADLFGREHVLRGRATASTAGSGIFAF